MKRIGIAEAKNRLSALIDGLKGGSPVLIMDRGRPVARLEPVVGGANGDDGEARLSRLVRDGIVRPGKASLPRNWLKDPLPPLQSGSSVVQALLDERRQGR